MDTNFRNVVAVGEEAAKKAFARTCLEPLQYTELENRLLSKSELMFEIIHSGNASALPEKIGNNRFRFKSEKLPFGIRLFLIFSIADWTEDVHADDVDIILFTTVFPYANNENLFEPLEHITQYLESLPALKSKLYQFRVVFIKEIERKFGATDLINEEEELQRAPQKIKSKLISPVKELIDFKTYATEADLPAIFSHSKKTEKLITVICDIDYRKWTWKLEDFKRDFQDDYNLGKEKYTYLTGQDFIDDATRFERVKGCLDLWKKYCDNYISRHQNDIIDFMQRIYEEYLPCFCFWDKTKDFNKIVNEIVKLYYETMGYTRRIACPQIRADYSKLLAEEKLDIEFTVRLNYFFEKKIPDYLDRILKKKEEILSEYCVISE